MYDLVVMIDCGVFYILLVNMGLKTLCNLLEVVYIMDVDKAFVSFKFAFVHSIPILGR